MTILLNNDVEDLITLGVMIAQYDDINVQINEKGSSDYLEQLRVDRKDEILALAGQYNQEFHCIDKILEDLDMYKDL